ncbi:MAG TPA: hypothetical protein VFQ24_00390 [Terriglobia bacterium]|nr:hypothetical protein [Terriglobia bacterium]
MLLLVAALSAFATYRYVKAGGKGPSDAADKARIAELQTRLKSMQDRVNELERRRHAAPGRRTPGTTTAKAAPGQSSLLAASLARPGARLRGETPASDPSHSTSSRSISTKLAATAPASVKAPELATKAPATNGQTVPTKELNAIQGNLAASHDEWRAATDRLGNVVGELDTQRSAIQQTQNGVNYLLERVQASDVSFTLSKGAGLHRIGPIPMELESTSVREQHYTVRMMVDDKSVVLKDRALNEIVQFYTSRSKYPLRLIVSQIGRGEVSGTLAVPTELSDHMNNNQLQGR